MKRSAQADDGTPEERGPRSQRQRIDESALHEAVKAGQRVSPEWKDAWRHWCESTGHTMYDPTKHGVDHIAGFFRHVAQCYMQNDRQHGGYVNMANAFGQPPNPARPPTQRHRPQHGYQSPGISKKFSAVGNGGCGELIELVKAGQRANPTWKESWADFCQANGNGLNDPNKHSKNPLFFVAFCFKYGLGLLGAEEWAQPYLSNVAQVAMPYIVEAIKQGQRADQQWKEKWIQFVEETGSTFRDPNRHDAGTLLQYMDTVAMPQFSERAWMQSFLTGNAVA